jgi:hypothetical protein
MDSGITATSWNDQEARNDQEAMTAAERWKNLNSEIQKEAMTGIQKNGQNITDKDITNILNSPSDSCEKNNDGQLSNDQTIMLEVLTNLTNQVKNTREQPPVGGKSKNQKRGGEGEPSFVIGQRGPSPIGSVKALENLLWCIQETAKFLANSLKQCQNPNSVAAQPPQQQSGGGKPVLKKLTVPELKNMAKRKKLTGYSSMNKNDLIRLLQTKNRK